MELWEDRKGSIIPFREGANNKRFPLSIANINNIKEDDYQNVCLFDSHFLLIYKIYMQFFPKIGIDT
jgi:hypothetical protein